MSSLGEAIRDMHAAAGEAERAAELERTAIAQLASLSAVSARDRSPGLDPGTALRERAGRQRSDRDVER
jgi:hypothetical protein